MYAMPAGIAIASATPNSNRSARMWLSDLENPIPAEAKDQRVNPAA